MFLCLIFAIAERIERRYLYGLPDDLGQGGFARALRFLAAPCVGRRAAKLRIRALEILVQPVFPHDFFLLLLVADVDNLANKLVQPARADHLVKQRRWGCVTMVEEVEEPYVAYLRNFAAP